MLIAQLTDSHVLPDGELLSGWVDTRERFEHCITWLDEFNPRPDVVLFTGDLIDKGTKEEYEIFRQIVDKLDIPYFVVPGNHDHRENFREAFKDKKYIDPKNEFIQYVIDDYPVRLIGLDTHVPGEMHGELCATRLDWLEETLKKETEKPTVIFMHHPPFNSGLNFMDKINCRDGDKLAEIIAGQTNIERVLCGHVHRQITVEWAGTIGIVAPSAAVQLALELNEVPPENIVPWAAHEQPAFLLHRWDENNGIISHVNHVCATK